jgi:eukaryotic-like serine/threonine-protein kinase
MNPETLEQPGGTVLDGDAFALADRLIAGMPEPIAMENFGSYRIESRIGTGGMGEVFQAWDEGAGRRVAIKFLRQPWAERDLAERFGREIKAHAILEHPLIARLYEAGVHPNGTPYFVMEYVEGKPLDEYCREHECSVEQRLDLFYSVCEAVQYAHNMLVIHRDLKPSNILVKSDGTVKLLDFGIAKQLESLETPIAQEQTELRFTRAYVSPEQLRREQPGVYMDVYSLGVILYELLAGRPPFDLESRTPAEAEMLISGEQEPERPSLTARRKGNPQPGKAAWGDLDVLCLTAVKKDVRKRYLSVVELMQDIDRYRKGEPLKARPDTLRYRAGKYLRRNRRALAAGTAAAALLAAVIVYFTARLTTARNAALAEAAQTQRVEGFLENLFAGGDKDAGPKDDLRVVTLLDRGVQEAQGLKRDRMVQADMYQTLGTIYQRLGKLDKAEGLLRSALEERKSVLGPDRAEVGEGLLALGMLRQDQGQLPEAERLVQQAIAIDERRLPPGHPATAKATAALGKVLNERGEYDKAIEVLNRARQMQSAQSGVSSDLADTLDMLADAQFYLDHYDASDSLNRQVLKLLEQLHGSQHPSVADVYMNLGHIQFNLGHYPEAEADYRRALAIDQGWYGKDHPDTARAAQYVAQALAWEGKYTESRDLLKPALAVMERAYGEMHPRLALVLSNLGMVDDQLGNMQAAVADHTRMLEIYRSTYGERHQFTALAMNDLGSDYSYQGKYAAAERFFREALKIDTQVLPAGHLNTGIAQIKLGRVLAREKRYQEALGYSLAGYQTVAKQASPSLEYLQAAREDLAKIYDALGQPEQAAKFRAELEANRPRKATVQARK